VVAKVRDILAVNKQSSHTFHMERFYLKKLNEAEGKVQCRVEFSNRFPALEDLDAEVEINSAWETIRENIKNSAKESLGYYDMEKHKPWFDEAYSELIYQKERAKLQWLQHPSNVIGDNLNNAQREARWHFRNKKREYLKDKINELAKELVIRDLYGGIQDFKRGYQPRNNLVDDENDNLQNKKLSEAGGK
jgi:hypothetical protein